MLSILPPGEALGLARRLGADRCAARSGAVIFADCNAVSPETVRAVAAALPGVRFADIGIIGGPPQARRCRPAPLRVRRRGRGVAARCASHGIDLRPIAGGVGAASALKMSYAGITKGLIALGSAMALGATASGAAAALRAELAASQPEMLRFLERGVPGMFDKAYRWVAEMEEIAAFLGEIPAAPIYEGAARLYDFISKDRAAPAPGGPVAKLAAFYRKG